MSLQHKKELRSRLVREAKELLTSRGVDMSLSQMIQFDNIMEKVDSLEGEIQREERSERLSGETRTSPRVPRSQPGAATNDNAEVRSAFSSFMRTGERRSILTSNGGGVLIPPAFYPTRIEAQKNWGALTAAVNQKPTESGANMDIALVNDTGNDLTLLAEMGPARMPFRPTIFFYRGWLASWD